VIAGGSDATRERPDSGLVPMVQISGRSNVHFWPPQSTLPDAKAGFGPVFAGVSRSTLPEQELDQIPDKDEVVGSTPISPTKDATTMKLFRRLLLVLSVASTVVGILRFGGSGKAKVTTKQGGWRSTRFESHQL
jgi:hypothetical protein